MDSKTMKFFASELVASIRQHVSERVLPFQARLDATATVLNDMSKRVDELEEQVKSLEERLTLRRVA